MEVDRECLRSVEGSALEAMFSGRHEVTLKNNKPFVDRDPETFKHILYFLENNKLPKLSDTVAREKLEEEIDYWAIQLPVDVEIQHILEKEPVAINDFWAVKRWQSLGPLDVEQLLEENKIEIDPNQVVSEDESYVGQMDMNGEKQGIGRNCVQKFGIYEGQFH